MTATLLLAPAALEGEEVRVEGEAFRHLFRARRLGEGDAVRVVDGRGRARRARVAAVERRAATLALGEEAPSLEPALSLALFVPLPRPPRATWLVEKATEVGAAAVRFCATSRGPRSLGSDQLGRLVRVAAAAVEQCGRARVPEVTGVHPWEELPALLQGLSRRFVLDLREAAGPAPAAPRDLPPPGPGAAALLVGPEGGWSEAERRTLDGLDCRPLALGARTLRTETAAVVGAAALLLG